MQRFRVPEVILGFLVASAVWACVALWQSQKAVPSNEANPAKTEQQDSVASGSSVQHKEHSEGHQKGNWYDTFLNHTPDWFVAVFTALLTFVTYRLVSSTNKLWEAGERQIELARKTATAQSHDMQDSITAANRSAAAAERALTDLERPWLFAFGIKAVPINQLGEWTVEFTVANFGKMPAIIEHARIGFVISDRAEPPTPLFAEDDHDLVVSPILQAGERRIIKEAFPNVEDGSASFRVLQSPSGEIVSDPAPGYEAPPGFDAFFRVIINYRGPSTKGHESCVLWLYQPPIDFLNRGGEEYNYTN